MVYISIHRSDGSQQHLRLGGCLFDYLSLVEKYACRNTISHRFSYIYQSTKEYRSQTHSFRCFAMGCDLSNLTICNSKLGELADHTTSPTQ